MIIGIVNAFKQAVIALELHGPYGKAITVDAVIDTGFDGHLAVTPEITADLQLPFRETRTYQLGSGKLVDFAIHNATVVWDGELRDVAALVTDGGILLGMSMLSGCTLFIHAVDGGDVRIDSKP